MTAPQSATHEVKPGAEVVRQEAAAAANKWQISIFDPSFICVITSSGVVFQHLARDARNENGRNSVEKHIF